MKRKKKLFIWIGSIVGALAIIVCVGGYFAINYAADKMLDSLADSIDLEPAESASASPSPSGTASLEGDASATPSSGVPSTPNPSIEASASPSSTTEEAKPSGNSSGAGAKDAGQASQSSKTGANSGSGESPSRSPMPSPSSTYNPEISVDKAEEVKESISFSEKTKVMAVMLKRLSPSDIKTLQQLASGGLTVEKKKEAKELILKKLTEDEYNELIAIAKKYGLSQGKSYEESLKEDLSN
ncbi:hypothetical protein [Cohnella laeviribosi]|uniref:hypothetical protein n=1 Tax=Cohnella laeviribosi TaxID=380174 RepID=UPI003D1BDA5E